MAIKKFFRICLFIIAFTLSIFSLHAQNPEDSRSTVVRTEDGLKVRQIISFPALENILRYEIEIQRLTDSRRWTQAEKLETETNRFEVSLAAGDYRYRYTAYNKMNLIEGRSNWQTFTLIPAIQPNPMNYRPFYGMYYEMKDFENIIIVYGEDFSPETEFALVKGFNHDWSGVTLRKQKDIIIPIHTEINETEALLTFSDEPVSRGIYHIFARNPGGLWSSVAEVRVGFHHDSDSLIEYGWAPAFENGDLYPDGFFIRFNWFPFKTKIGSFGIGAQGFIEDNDNGSTNYGFFNLIYQSASKGRFQHNIRFGFFPDWYYEGGTYYDDTYGQWYYQESEEFYWMLNLGYSMQYFVWKNLYASIGIDFNWTTGSYRDDGLQIRPAIGFGWQFGRWADQIEVINAARNGLDHSVPVTKPPQTLHEQLLSIGWSPMIPLAGIQRSDNDREYLGIFNPLGLNIKYGAFPYRWNGNKLGLGFDIAILDHKNRTKIDEEYVILDLLSYFMPQIYYLRELSEKTQIGVRAGFGISNPHEYTQSFDGPLAAANFGISMQYFLRNNLFVEPSLNIIYMGIWSDDHSRVVMRPGLSIGWQFNRNAETGLRLHEPGSPLALTNPGNEKPPVIAEESISILTDTHTDPLDEPAEQSSLPPVIVYESQWSTQIEGGNASAIRNTTANFAIANEVIQGQEKTVLTLTANMARGAQWKQSQFWLDNDLMYHAVREGTGIRFKVLGDGGNGWELHIPTWDTYADENHYHASLTTRNNEVMEIDIPYSVLRRNQSERNIPFTKQNNTGIAFFRNAGAGSNISGNSVIKIFDIEFYSPATLQPVALRQGVDPAQTAAESIAANADSIAVSETEETAAIAEQEEAPLPARERTLLDPMTIKASDWSSKIGGGVTRGSKASSVNHYFSKEIIDGEEKIILNLETNLARGDSAYQNTVAEFEINNAELIQRLRVGAGIRFKVKSNDYDKSGWSVGIQTPKLGRGTRESPFYTRNFDIRSQLIEMPYNFFIHPQNINYPIKFNKRKISKLMINRYYSTHWRNYGESKIQIYDFEIYLGDVIQPVIFEID